MKTTTRTIQYLRKLGLRCQTVEKWNPFAKRNDGKKGIYQDLFEVIDIVCLQERGWVLIQACGTDFQEHIRKITIEKAEITRDILSLGKEQSRPNPGVYFELWGWRKVKKVKGGKAMVWKPRIQEIKLGDLE